VYKRAELHVSRKVLPRYPEVQQFVEKSLPGFPLVSIKVRAGVAVPLSARASRCVCVCVCVCGGVVQFMKNTAPQIVFFDADGKRASQVPIVAWKREVIEDFLREKLAA
jgi:hypothetical protein